MKCESCHEKEAEKSIIPVLSIVNIKKLKYGETIKCSHHFCSTECQVSLLDKILQDPKMEAEYGVGRICVYCETNKAENEL